jgi:hypothetical protein
MNVTDYPWCSFHGITILKIPFTAVCVDTAVCIAMMKLKNNAPGRKKGKGTLEFECHKKCRVTQARYTVTLVMEKHKLSL